MTAILLNAPIAKQPTQLYGDLPMSAAAYQKHGVPRSLVQYLLINNWKFPPLYKDLLKTYYLLHWEGSHFADKLRDGSIIHNNETYIVIYKGCTYYTAKHASQLKLSFRKVVDDYNLPAYVIVTI